MSFVMEVLAVDSPEENGEVKFLSFQRFNDDATILFANVDGIIEAQMRGLQDGGGDSNRSAISAALDGGLHWDSFLI